MQANKSRIGEIDPTDTDNFICSSNYMQTAIDLGLYDPASGDPFIWKYTYRDCRGRTDERLWRVFSTLNPSGNWQFDDVENFPFSVKPDAKVDVQDVIALYHDTLEGTPYDIQLDPIWTYTYRDAETVSPFKGPQVPRDMTRWLGLTQYRNIAVSRCSYYFVGQCRGWLPDEIGGLLWFGLNNAATSPWIPVWVGVDEVPESWTTLDRKKVDRNSAWWAFELADNLTNMMYTAWKPTLDAVHEPLQAEINAMAPVIEQAALSLYAIDRELAIRMLTNFTCSMMTKSENLYWDLVDQLLFLVPPR